MRQRPHAVVIASPSAERSSSHSGLACRRGVPRRAVPQVPVVDSTGKAVVSPAVSTRRGQMAVSGQRLLATGGQNLLATHSAALASRSGRSRSGGDRSPRGMLLTDSGCGRAGVASGRATRFSMPDRPSHIFPTCGPRHRWYRAPCGASWLACWLVAGAWARSGRRGRGFTSRLPDQQKPRSQRRHRSKPLEGFRALSHISMWELSVVPCERDRDELKQRRWPVRSSPEAGAATGGRGLAVWLRSYAR
jgi:hypothetical protein